MKKKNILKKIFLALVMSMLLCVTVASVITPVYADETSTEASGGPTSVSELETKATSSIGSLQKSLVNVCLAICPLSLIIALALMLFTHDDRKISGYIKICITICVVTALILLVNSGAVVSIIKDFIGITN